MFLGLWRGKEDCAGSELQKERWKNILLLTDRWQKFTEVALSPQILDELAEYCDEFLIHGVDVEGKDEDG